MNEVLDESGMAASIPDRPLVGSQMLDSQPCWIDVGQGEEIATFTGFRMLGDDFQVGGVYLAVLAAVPIDELLSLFGGHGVHSLLFRIRSNLVRG